MPLRPGNVPPARCPDLGSPLVLRKTPESMSLEGTGAKAPEARPTLSLPRPPIGKASTRGCGKPGMFSRGRREMLQFVVLGFLGGTELAFPAAHGDIKVCK